MSVSSALRKLRLRHISQQDLEEIYRQIDMEENDRGAAILSALTIEAGLTIAITRRLPNSQDVSNQLFENNGPLESLDGKILIAQAIGILGKLTRQNLDIVKHVRNTFAHGRMPILFSTKEIVDACNALTVPPNPQRFFERDLIIPTPRSRFTGICEVTTVALLIYASGCGPVRADLMRPDAMIPMTPEPLP
jgi:hypothetical protein